MEARVTEQARLAAPLRRGIVEETVGRAHQSLVRELASFGRPYVILSPDPVRFSIESPAALVLDGFDGVIGILLVEDESQPGSVYGKVSIIASQLDEADLDAVVAVAGPSPSRLAGALSREGFSVVASDALPMRRPAVRPLLASCSPARLPRASFEGPFERPERPSLPAGGEASLGGSFWVPASAHTFCVGATGSGKTVSFAVPAILRCARSKSRPDLLVTDAKDTLRGILVDRVAQEGYEVRVLDLRGNSPDRLNPLDVAARAAKAGLPGSFDLLRVVLDPIYDTVADSQDRFWTAGCSHISQAVFACLAALSVTPTLSKLGRVFGMNADTVKELGRRAGGESGIRLKSALAASKAEQTWASLSGVGAAAFSYFTSSAGESVSGVSTFDLEKALGNTRKPLALFVIQPDETRGGELYSALVINQAIAIRTRAYEIGRAPDRDLHIFADEFGSLPRSDIGSVLSRGRSRRIYAHLFLQSVEQLYERGVYSRGEASTMLNQAQAIYYMRTPGVGGEENLRHLCPGVRPGVLSRLRTGEVIIQSLGSPLVRTYLSPAECFMQ